VKESDSDERRAASSYTVDEMRAMTPGERIALCWELTVEAYGLTEDTRLRRDITRVIRRGERDE